MRFVIGVDVGGTTTAAGVVSEGGEVLLEEQSPTHGDGPDTSGATIARLATAMSRRAAEERLPVAAVGIGVPAIVDAAGRIGEAHHVADLTGQTLGPALGARLGLPVFVDNDVNALALGEWTFGAGKGARSLVVLAAGTGFGAGIVLDGRVVRGAAGFGGELGHVPVKFDGRACWCGGRGCLAVYASGRGIGEAGRAAAAATAGAGLRAAAGGDPARVTAATVFAVAAAGDAVAGAIVDEAVRALGALLATVVNGLNPEVIVLTGGVAAALAPLEPRLLAVAASHAFRQALASTRISIVPSDKRLTVRGAAALALQELRSAPANRRGHP
ncbi:MAG: ROK family protein [Candidatus Rokubacteria bacterium]|nr:ROK family protein [Candidatus Rokubacteria bacterium]